MQQLRPIHGPTQERNISENVSDVLPHILKPRHAPRSLTGNSGVDCVCTEGTPSPVELLGSLYLGYAGLLEP